MKRLLLAIAVLGIAAAFPAQNVTPEEDLPFQPAEAQSVTDISVPPFPASEGTVVLDALITESGKVEQVEVRRDLGHYSQVAAHAVEDWQFSPATMAGKAIASRIPIAVTFRPPYTFADPVPLPTFVPQSDAAMQAEFQPAEVLHAEFPRYPPASVVTGTVILQVTLSAEGKAGDIQVVRDIAPLTDEARAVVGRWRFMAATWNGHPVPSKIVLVFLFPRVYESLR